jgi:DNA-binding response OmpR family regulator
VTERALSEERLTVGAVTLDRAAHLVTVGARAVLLAHQEFRLLDLLMSRADHVVSNEQILRSIWGDGFGGDPGTVAVHISRLRRKLGLNGTSDHLRTVRGLGYIFDSTPVSPSTTR